MKHRRQETGYQVSYWTDDHACGMDENPRWARLHVQGVSDLYTRFDLTDDRDVARLSNVETALKRQWINGMDEARKQMRRMMGIKE